MAAAKAVETKPVLVTPPVPSTQRRLLIDLLLALVIAVPFGVQLLGTAAINPFDISWMRGDAAGSYIAAAMFGENTRLYWPLSYTPNLGYPVGETIAIEDATPLAAIVLWPLSHLIPTHFQYFGPYMLFSLALQAFVAIQLIRSFAGNKWIGLALGAALFVISPPLIYRCAGHFSLTSHWFILLGLLFYRYCLLGMPFRRKFICAAGLCALAASTNPYLFAMVLGLVFAALVADAIRLKTIVPGAIIFAGSLAVAILCLYSLGFMTGAASDYVGRGYRIYALDLLSPIAPVYGSLLMREPPIQDGAAIDAYNYLGLGVILLLVAVIPGCIDHLRGIGRLRRYWPLAAVAFVYTLLAMSTQMHAAGRVFLDIDPKGHLTPVLGALRGSGRLFWIAFYSIILAGVVASLRFFSYRTACILLTICVVIQYADTKGVRALVAGFEGGPQADEKLYSPLWNRLGPRYKHLAVMPAFQCWSLGIPGPLGGGGWQQFGLLAAEHRMSINSYYAPRDRAVSLKYHCDTEIDDMRNKPLAPDTAYVVTPGIAAMVEAGPSGSGKCQEADKVILCSADELNGPRNKRWAVPFNDAEPPGLPGMSKYLLSGFSDYRPDVGAWSDGDGIIAFRLNPEQLRTTGSVRLMLLVLAAEEPDTFEIRYHGGVFKGTYTGWPDSVTGAFEVYVPIDRGNEVQAYRIRTLVRHQPSQVGLDPKDTRRMGLGIHAVALSSCPAGNDLYGYYAKPLPPCANANAPVKAPPK